MQVLTDTSSRSSAEVDPDVESIGFESGSKDIDGTLHLCPQLTELVGVEIRNLGNLTIGKNEDVSRRIRKRVHDREDPFTAMDDERLIVGQSGIEDLAKDARTASVPATTFAIAAAETGYVL